MTATPTNDILDKILATDDKTQCPTPTNNILDKILATDDKTQCPTPTNDTLDRILATDDSNTQCPNTNKWYPRQDPSHRWQQHQQMIS